MLKNAWLGTATICFIRYSTVPGFEKAPDFANLSTWKDAHNSQATDSRYAPKFHRLPELSEGHKYFGSCPPTARKTKTKVTSECNITLYAVNETGLPLGSVLAAIQAATAKCVIYPHAVLQPTLPRPLITDRNTCTYMYLVG